MTKKRSHAEFCTKKRFKCVSLQSIEVWLHFLFDCITECCETMSLAVKNSMLQGKFTH